MKTIILLFSVSTLFLLSSCEKDLTNDDCIQDKIDLFIAENTDNLLTRIDQYTYQGETVYGFDTGIPADGFMDVYSETCVLLCSVGGLIGTSECNGGNFFTEATDRVVIWEH